MSKLSKHLGLSLEATFVAKMHQGKTKLGFPLPFHADLQWRIWICGVPVVEYRGEKVADVKMSNSV